MIVQEWGGGLVRALPPEGITAGPIEWGLAIVMAVWLTQQIHKLIQNINERRNGAADLYMDPRTGARLSYPARNLQILHDLVEEGCERTEYIKANGEKLDNIEGELKTMNGKLIYTGDAFIEKIGEEMREAVSDEMKVRD